MCLAWLAWKSCKVLALRDRCESLSASAGGNNVNTSSVGMVDELPSLPGVSFCTQVLLYFRVLCPSGAVNILELGRRAESCQLLEGLLLW